METNEQLTVLTDIEQESVELFKGYLTDLLKFRTKGTASAAARARKKASTLAKLFKPVRKGIQLDKVAKIKARRENQGIKVTSL
jgi:hypothetical protein